MSAFVLVADVELFVAPPCKGGVGGGLASTASHPRLPTNGIASIRNGPNLLANAAGAVQRLVSEAAECLGGTHPQPLPGREGSKVSATLTAIGDFLP
jgi:hypothetical protein